MSRRHTGGTSLVECVIYVSVALVIMNLGGLLLFRSFRLQRRLDDHSTNLIRLIQAGERWRQEVRTSRLEPVAAGPQVWLAPPEGDASWRLQDGVLERGTAGSNWGPALRGVADCTWTPVDLPGISGWRMEVTMRGNGPDGRGPAMTFLAVWKGGAP